MLGGNSSRHPGFGVLVALSLLASASSVAAEQAAPSAAASSEGVVVVLPQMPPAISALGPGVRYWLHRELDEADLALVDPRPAVSVDEAVAPRVAWRTLAAGVGASHLLLSQAHLELGQLRLRLTLVEGESGEILAGAERSGPFAELGVLLQQASRALQQLELPTGDLATRVPPRLSELAALGRALERLEAGDFAAARRELDGHRTANAEALRGRIRREAGRRGVPLARKARLAIAEGDLDRSWLRLRNELRKADDPELLLAAGDAAIERGETPRAVAFYQRAARFDPGNPEIHLGEGRAHRELGNTDDARKAYTRASDLLPGDPRALEALAGLPSTSAEDRAQLLLRAGSLQAGRFETVRAQQSFETSASLDPAVSGPAQLGLGDVLQLVGQTQGAIDRYEQALSLGAGEPQTWATLGSLQRAQGDAVGAQRSLGQALSGDPNHGPAHREMGELLVETGKPEEGLGHLQKAFALAPEDGRSRRALAQLVHAQGSSERALPLLHTGQDGAPANAEDLRTAAKIRGESGDLDGARLALEHAALLAPTDGSLQQALARVHEARGDGAAAAESLELAATLSGTGVGDEAPAQSGQEEARSSFESLVGSFPARRFGGRSVTLLSLSVEQTWQDRLLQLLQPRRVDPFLVQVGLENAIASQFEFDPDPPVAPEVVRDLERLRAFETDRRRIALVNDVLVTEGIFVARIKPAPDEDDPPGLMLELQLLAGREPAGVIVYANQVALASAAFETWNPVALSLYGALVLLSLLPVLRGWGTVRVTLDYGKATGFFSIKLSRRAEKVKQAKKQAGTQISHYQRRLRSLGRFERYMADRETFFRWIPARRYHVAVHGLLQDPVTEQVVGNYFEERIVQVSRRRQADLHFDFRPKEAAVTLQIYLGDELAPRAQVAQRDSVQPLKYAHDGQLVLPLVEGEHTLVVGCEGCVMERVLSISNLEPVTLSFATTEPRTLVFRDCEEAVEPYLNGEMLAAAEALERAGQTEVAHSIRAHHYQESGDADRAAAHFQAAGRLEEAAELGAFSDDPERSASLYQQAGDFARAAEAYREAGDPQKAAEAYEASYEYEQAIEAYRMAGRPDKVMELLEKTGGFYEAGVLALEAEDLERAVRNLQQVDLRDPDYAMACRMLADAVAERGEFDLAAAKLREAVEATGGEARADVQLLARLGDLLERAGDCEGALGVYEAVRRRDMAYPDAATRIQELRKVLGSEKASAGAETVGPAEVRASSSEPQAESRYELVEEIGRGGMGVVFKARDRRLGRIVALKRLPENLRNHPTAVKLFLREARAVAALNHPNIVTLYDADQEDGSFFITMEYLDGFPLNTIVKKRGQLSPKDAVRIGLQVATGLHYAHERRIVHRDIKTANLFFTRERSVKIMDFGLAKMMEEVRKAATIIGGTPYYMAPEQAVGENVDERADLYALGVTLFELVTGTVPFTNGDLGYHHRHTPPPDPRGLAELPDALAELILSLLAKRPEDRPSSAGEVGRQLQRIAASPGGRRGS